jgi:hypothetical protein
VVNAQLNNGSRTSMRFTVMDVRRPIASVSRMVRSGHKVVFDDLSYIQNKTTGEKIRIFERNGVYTLPAWLEEPPHHSNSRHP